MALTDKLSAIGEAIRAKGGTTELLTLDAMPLAIANLPSGGGGTGGGDAGDIEPFVWRGTMDNSPFNAIIPYAVKTLGKYITTSGISNVMYAFANFDGEEIPFSINCAMSPYHSDAMFQYCYNLKACPEINYLAPRRLTSFFEGCQRMRTLPENFGANWDWSGTQSMTQDMHSVFCGCFSLRKIPEHFLKNFYSGRTSNGPYQNMFTSCYTLHEIRNLGVQPSMSSDGFYDAFRGCSMLTALTFTPGKTANWSNQVIDLSKHVGYAGDPEWIMNYNSGVDYTYKITDWSSFEDYSTYEDSWTEDWRLSKYTRYSAEETLISLPNVSSGSGNTIIFKSDMGENTSWGAISSIEESYIAQAAAKGWTVSFV